MEKNNVISTVIVNWNGAEVLPALLRSLADAQRECAQRGTELEVVVVDNASADGSPELLRAAPLRLRLVESPVNLGFAGGCNLGASHASGEVLLFLNPDTQVTAQALLEPAHLFTQPGYADVGIIGIQLLDEGGRVTRSCARFPRPAMFALHSLGLTRLRPEWGHPMLEWDHRTTREVDQVIGAFFMVRTELFQRLRGFDESFFVYFEEVDFAYRARQLGYRSLYFAGAQAVHSGGGTTEQVRGRRLFYALRSRLIYGLKHFGPAQNLLNFAVTLVLEPLARAAFALLGRGRDWPALREGFGLLYADLPATLLRPRRHRSGYRVPQLPAQFPAQQVQTQQVQTQSPRGDRGYGEDQTC